MSEDRTIKMGFERAGELEQVKLGDLLWDAHAAGMKLLEFTAGRDFNEYVESELLQSVVRTLLVILADRLQQIERQFPAEFAKIAKGPLLIASVGFADGSETMWRVVEDKLPDAVTEIREVLEHWHEA